MLVVIYISLLQIIFNIIVVQTPPPHHNNIIIGSGSNDSNSHGQIHIVHFIYFLLPVITTVSPFSLVDVPSRFSKDLLIKFFHIYT